MLKKQESVCEHFLLIENHKAMVNDSIDILNKFRTDKKFINKNISKRVLCLECKFLKKAENLQCHRCVSQCFLDPNKNIIICGTCKNSIELEYFMNKDLTLESIEIKPKGLQNLGNTCFMNSVLQIFFGNDLFLNIIFKHKECKISNCIYCGIKKDISFKNDNLNLLNFWETFTIRNILYKDYGQHDSQEFFNSLCNSLHDCSFYGTQLIKKKCYCISHYLFSGSFSTKLKCKKCLNIILHKTEQFFEISLPINNLDVIKMLTTFFNDEEIDVQMNCNNCQKKQKIQKGTEIYEYPRILTLHLKLFTFKDKKLSKISKKVNFPFKIKLSKTHKYKLIGVVTHSGSLNYGHYTSYVLKNKQWFYCNDNSIKKVAETEVLNASPYLLFYELNI